MARPSLPHMECPEHVRAHQAGLPERSALCRLRGGSKAAAVGALGSLSPVETGRCPSYFTVVVRAIEISTVAGEPALSRTRTV